MGDDSEKDYDIPFPRYKWVVYLEMRPVAITIEADTAEEAMEIADASYQLKTLPLDDLPELESVSANLTGVTEEFANIMDEVKTRK